MTELVGHKPIQYCFSVSYCTCNFLYAEAFRLVPGPHDAVGRKQPREGIIDGGRGCLSAAVVATKSLLGVWDLRTTGVASVRDRTCHSAYNTFSAQTDEILQ